MQDNMVRTRIAPSPTGYPHIGTIYQALFNYAFARKHKGSFVVRIEDTDRARFVEGAEDVIYQAIDWFDLTEDESPRKAGEVGPYRQSERLGIYHKYAEELIKKGHAKYVYYKKEESGKRNDYDKNSRARIITETTEKPPQSIKEMIERGDWVIRMFVPHDKKIIFTDEIRGDITFDTSEVTEQVLIKSDGFPTYHFAVVVDDHLMGITHLVRGEEWISSAPKHVLLYRYFGWDMPKLYHTPTLRNPDKSKLSKRYGHTNVQWFKEEGYLPEAILNFLALMGWTHPDEKEIFSLSEFINVFDLKDIKQVGPIFDLTKLTWMNGEYIRKMSVKDLMIAIKEYYDIFEISFNENKLSAEGVVTEEKKEKIDFLSVKEDTFQKIVELAQTRIDTLKQFHLLAMHFLPDAKFFVNNETDKEIAASLNTQFQNIKDWNKDSILEALRVVLKKHSIRMPVLYTIITGQERGLPLPESLEILGKEPTLARLAQ
jgi:glutamyl-tRNA synthetase